MRNGDDDWRLSGGWINRFGILEIVEMKLLKRNDFELTGDTDMSDGQQK